MDIRVHILISGKVQGVFFRLETYHRAIEKNVTGWVKNRSDGRVEAIFEGNKENVQRLIDFCENGPKGAIVNKVEIKWERYTGTFSDFKIRRSTGF
jgi:acylphosphatase